MSEPPGIDTTVPHSARIWNHWLGGQDNYPVDRRAAEEFSEIFPGMADVARAVRAFLARAVRYLGHDNGIRQFLDIGSHLVLSDGTDTDKAREEAHRRYNSGGAVPYLLRSPAQITRFFDGLELVPPGVVSVSQWRPGSGPAAAVSTYGGVARKT